MDLDGIREVCGALGLKLGKPYSSAQRGPNVSVACLLAPWRHQDPNDRNTSCSVTINEEGPSLARCHSFNCDFKGSWLRMVRMAILFREPTPDHLIDLLLKVSKTEEFGLERMHEVAAARDAKAIAGTSELPSAIARPTIASVSPVPRAYDRDVLNEQALSQFDTTVPTYVIERGVTVEAAAVWGLCFDTRLDRVVFPVRRVDGLLVGMTGRILPYREKTETELGRDVTKYHNYVGLNKTRYLYGAHLFRRSLPVIVTEGPIDAIKTWQALRDRADVCATLGQGFGEDHRRTICSVQPPTVYIFMDNDHAGRLAAAKVAAQLEDSVSLKLMRAFGGKDPGDMNEADIVAAFEKADPILGADAVWIDIPL